MARWSRTTRRDGGARKSVRPKRNPRYPGDARASEDSGAWQQANRTRQGEARWRILRPPGIRGGVGWLNPEAETPVSADLLEWADVIFVMERAHRASCRRNFARSSNQSESSVWTFQMNLSLWTRHWCACSKRKLDHSSSGADELPCPDREASYAGAWLAMQRILQRF